MKRTTRAGLFLALLLPACWVACASRPIEVREYILAPAATAGPAASAGHEFAIGVGPVVVPRYLRRSEIVTRVGTNELRASETHRWGEDLDRGLARVVAEDLALLLPGSQVAAFPWRGRGPMDYRVGLEVRRFEPAPDGSVTLEARWSVSRGGDTDTAAGGRTSIREESSSSDPAAAVDAMSRAAARLSQEIAEAIRVEASRPLAE